jgi:hypothetical protein
MKFAKRIICPIFITSLVIVFLSLISCSKYEETVPFSDGLFLEYNTGGISTIFSFERLENFNYKIIETETRKPLRDKVTELFVDNYGIVYKSSFKDYEGGFSPVWIPIYAMKVGDSYDEGYKVSRKDRWKKWDVMVIKNPIIKEEQYFEINTGYLVGAKGKFGLSYELVLVNTNADIPTVEP